MDTEPGDVSKFAAMAKVFCGDVAMEVATKAVKVFGGYGLLEDYPVEKMMRDAKILQIYEGTNEIQRNIIGQELNKEYGRCRPVSSKRLIFADFPDLPGTSRPCAFPRYGVKGDFNRPARASAHSRIVKWENRLGERRVIVVTGASRGIGRAIAVEMAGPQTDIIVNYNSSPDAARQTAACRRQGRNSGSRPVQCGRPRRGGQGCIQADH